ncbi:hypothetical protein DPMN_011667, partial [Dreissena polymorpha]
NPSQDEYRDTLQVHTYGSHWLRRNPHKDTTPQMRTNVEQLSTTNATVLAIFNPFNPVALPLKTCSWTILTGTDISPWILNKGPTPSFFTGPARDHTTDTP